jgi:hypothetical protein
MPMQAQTILIDSTFTSDGEIFPFGPNDTIYGLSISGSVTLSSETSLVRVILTDNAGNEWMVYEAYPMIVTNTAFDIEEVCDETCYLEEFHPHSIKIQLIAASIVISDISCISTLYGNLAILQQQAKRSKDLEKVQLMNQYITSKGWDWVADTNELVNRYYQEKVNDLYNKYNLLGRDYYSEGSYYTILHDCIPQFNDNSIIPSFDWRAKHNANKTSSPYYFYDNEDATNGWITGLRSQSCQACAAFASIASLEAAINLYANYQFDAERHVRFSERDAFVCSAYDAHVGCDCDDGKAINIILNKIEDDCVVNEKCFPQHDDESSPYCPGTIPNCSRPNTSKCQTPDWTVSICNYKTINLTEGNESQTERANYLKELILENGPLIIVRHPIPDDESHALSLIGFKFNETTGKIDWIYKDSQPARYFSEPLYLGYNTNECPYIDNTVYAFDYNNDTCDPITITSWIEPTFKLIAQDHDFDNDGYYNWGIGQRPQHSYPCGSYVEDEEMEDSNDDNDTIGPYEEDYSGRIIKPELKVFLRSPQNIEDSYITNNSFFSFSSGDLYIDQELHFYVKNPGDAQLNLVPVGIIGEGKVEIVHVDGASGNFDITQLPQRIVCMGSANEFIVTFTGLIQGELTKIKIYLDENGEIPDFEFILVYNDCLPATQLETISRDQPWDTYALKNKDYLITGGATVTVTGEIALVENSDIFVDRGSKIIIDGGRLTSSCGDLWNGIDIWGNASMPQTTNYQGMVQIINGGTIEFAKTAISTSRINGIYTIPSGGIVSCRDAIFKDNIKDVEFYPFTNTHPVTHEILPNFSRFTRTRFETTDDLYNIFGVTPDVHLAMDGVGGIYIMACTFDNYSTQKTESRGIGIESNQSGYTISSACSVSDVIPCPGWQPCRFENLDYGVQAFNSNGRFTITVDSADFVDNYRGIYLRLVENPTIIKNTFEISDPDGFWPGESLVGLYLDEFTTGFVVEENKFLGSSPISSNVGIHLLNTGAVQNEIYNNYFSSLYEGVAAVGENRLKDTGVGLCIKCNVFTENNTDIYVTYEEDELGNPIITENTGIAFKQGIPNAKEEFDNTLAAGNTFSETSENDYINNKDCNKIIYTYQGINPPNNIIPDPFVGTIQRNPDPNARYTKDESCPSHLGGSINLSMEKSALETESELIAAYNDTLEMTIDGGNTEGLNFEVLTSFPEEALAIRQGLIERSPYLSDTVMITAIEKEDVLPSAMIRDVLVVNPQAPKSELIMSALEQRQDTIPEYMLEEINQGLNTYGDKELMEQRLGNHIANRDRSFNKLNLFYKNDTANFGASFDSLITLYQNESSLPLKYNLAFLYLDQSDSTNIFHVLDNLPMEFNLSTEELSNHNKYQELFNFVWQLISDTTTGLDSLQIQTLYNLSSFNKVIPGIFASNLLIKEGILDYNEPVYLVDLFKSAPIPNKDPQISIKTSHLRLFPNPAGTYFIAQYDITDQFYPGFLSILDVNGKELTTIPLKDYQNQVVIPCMVYPDGMYVIRLYSGRQLIDAKKISLIR